MNNVKKCATSTTPNRGCPLQRGLRRAQTLHGYAHPFGSVTSHTLATHNLESRLMKDNFDNRVITDKMFQTFLYFEGVEL